jgi:protein-S-isoprenylcysteine O-methyltransferase Ste14
MLEYIAWAEMLLCWVAWCLAFVKPRRQASKQIETERAAVSRWGIGLVVLAYAVVWTFIRPKDYHQPALQSAISMVLGPAAVWLAWAAAHRLGKQWRYQAALSADHELVRSGVYRWLRHPIYASMLGMFLTTGLAWSWWPKTILGLILFVAGTEIRVASEERLLMGRFPEYAAYRTQTAAYIPFLR